MSLADVIKTALDQMQFIAKTETVIGDPIKAGDITLIPVSRISIGFAAGGGGQEEKRGGGAGTGGGISITPVAFISVNGDRVQVHTLQPFDPILGKILSMAPEAIKKVSKFFDKTDKSDASGEKK